MSTRNCENCSVAYGPDDLFCENCGYDFVTGSLPDAEAGGIPSTVSAAPAPAPAPAVAPSVLSGDEGSEQPEFPAVPRVTVTVAVDKPFFDEVVSDGEIDFPDPPPSGHELLLAGTEFHIGRTSDSRAIHPDIDVADLTNDQAASSRHAVLRVAIDGTLTIVDVGSTNGTFIDAIDSEAISHGVPYSVEPGTPIYVGAWTRLTVTEASAS